MEFLLGGRCTLHRDAGSREDSTHRRSDPLALVALPMLLRLPHVEVMQSALCRGDHMHEQTVGRRLADPGLDQPVHLFVTRHVVEERVGHDPSRPRYWIDYYLIDRGVSL